MHIQEGYVAEKKSNYSKKETQPFRRLRKTFSSKKEDQEPNASLLSYQSLSFGALDSLGEELFTPRKREKINIKKVENIAALRNIHTCLRTILQDEKKQIILNQRSLLDVILTQHDQPLPKEMTEIVINHIYAKILRAMICQTYYFFDDKGYSVNLKDLDKLTEKSYGDSKETFIQTIKKELDDFYEDKPLFLFGEGVEGELEYLEKIGKLPLPFEASVDELSENKKLCLTLFQRLYPVRNRNNKGDETPIMAPITFLCSYKKFVTTEELFEQALAVLRLREEFMPIGQKMRVLNFLRVFFRSQIHKEEKLSKTTVYYLDKIIKYGLKSQNQELIDLSHEIKYITECHNLFHSGEESGKNLSQKVLGIEDLLREEPSKIPDYENFIKQISEDIKCLAGQAILSVTWVDLFNEKRSNESNIFYNNLIKFFIRSFVKKFEEQFKSTAEVKKIQRKLISFFEILRDVAYELAKKQDYLSSCAIYNIFYMPDINKLFNLLKENRHSSQKEKRHSVLKFCFDHDEKIKELDELYSTFGNFQNLREKMKECQQSGVHYIPIFAPLKNQLLHKVEMIENSFEREEEPKINNLKLQMLADEIWEVNEMLIKVTKIIKSGKVSLNTNIGYLILSIPGDHVEEGSLAELVKKLDKVLG